MQIFLLMIGIILILISFVYQYRAGKNHTSEIDFKEQFSMSQNTLETLLSTELESINVKINELETRLSEVTQKLADVKVDDNLMNSESLIKVQKFRQLTDEGYDLNQIMKILNMEKGELLFLENLSKKMSN